MFFLKIDDFSGQDKVRCCIDKTPSMTLRNSGHIFTPQFSKIHSNNILQSAPKHRNLLFFFNGTLFLCVTHRPVFFANAY
jgi:hypothetical protein